MRLMERLWRMQILDLSKLLMARYHYDYIKSTYGDRTQLLFTDTDSLAYEIKTEDIFPDRLKNPELFDMSDYPTDHPNYSVENKKVIGKFKEKQHQLCTIELNKVGLSAYDNKRYLIDNVNSLAYG